MNRMVITIPGVHPPSGNRYAREHWSRRSLDRAAWEKWLWAYGRKVGMRPNTATPATRLAIRICVVKDKRGRREDPANLDSRSKLVLDALVHLRVLWDDDAAHLDWRGVVEEWADERATRVEIDVVHP